MANDRLVETEIKILSDIGTISSVVKLLAYIRDVIEHQTNKTISVNVGSNFRGKVFDFQVNTQQIDKIIAKDNISIS